MGSLRARLVLVFALFSLLAALALAAGGAAVVQDRARTHAIETFAATHTQLERSLALRRDIFRATTELSYTLPIFRNVTGHIDQADFGLGTEEQDSEDLEALYQSLSASTWDWSSIAGEGFLVIAEAKGRVIYIHGHPEHWGMRLPDGTRWQAYIQSLGPAQHLLEGTPNDAIAELIPEDDPALQKLSLIAPAEARPDHAFLVMARRIELEGRTAAIVVQGVRAERLLADVALAGVGTRLGLVAPDGRAFGSIEAPLVTAAMAAQADEVVGEAVAGREYLLLAHPLPPLMRGGRSPATLIAARDLEAGIGQLGGVAGLFLTLALGLGLVAIGAALVVAKRITQPIESLDNAVRRVARGELDTRVESHTDDELGRLSRAFNAMTEGLRERDRIKATFKRYLAPEVVEYLLAHPEAQKLGGERRRLTVLFSDLAGFTSFSESQPPEEVLNYLNSWLSRISNCVAARGGTLDKYIGDAVMAFWGAPIPQADHAARACLAALDHLEVLETLRPIWKAAGLGTLDVRIGLNTGELVIGNIGGEGGQDYTVIGDAVNLASRLEGVNRIYRTHILIAEQTFLDAGSAIEARELDLVRVKGREAVVRIYELLGPKGWRAHHPTEAKAYHYYEAALSAFRNNDMPSCLEALQQMAPLLPQDGPALLLKRRAEAVLQGGSWEPVRTLDEK